MSQYWTFGMPMCQNIAYFTLLLIYRTYIYLKTCEFEYWQGFDDFYIHLLVLNLVPLRKSCSLKHSCVYASRSDDWLVLEKVNILQNTTVQARLILLTSVKTFCIGVSRILYKWISEYICVRNLLPINIQIYSYKFVDTNEYPNNICDHCNWQNIPWNLCFE